MTGYWKLLRNFPDFQLNLVIAGAGGVKRLSKTIRPPVLMLTALPSREQHTFIATGFNQLCLLRKLIEGTCL